MESGAELVVSGPGLEPGTVGLSRDRVTVGRLPGENDIALEPDPERLVTRVAHCTFERDGGRWFVVDGGGVNGTYLTRGGGRERVSGRAPLADGDVVSVLASVDGSDRAYFELAFHARQDSQATRAVPIPGESCLRYDVARARLVLVRGDGEHEVPIRAQAHRLVRYMVERNEEAGGSPVLCTHDELMKAVWADEPIHTREEVAKIVWELRKKLEPFAAEDAIENERGLGYRLRTCRTE
jgi:pSer/pThr/pTyr-binding forkhead associated (FHA) protein